MKNLGSDPQLATTEKYVSYDTTKSGGLTPTFEEILNLQQTLVARRQRGEGVDTLILCEHPACYTLGVGAVIEDLRGARDVPIYRVGRGGGVTWHGPGQLIGYPILRLRDWNWRVSDYVCMLERTLIATVRAFGVDAHCEGSTRGVYVEDRKLASIGIQVSRGVVWHGFALNVSCDLAPFKRIVPCRQPHTRMTSLAQELDASPSLDAVQHALVEQLQIRTRYGTLMARGGERT